MYMSKADFALHMEGSHADFAPHMERRHSCRDQKIAKFARFANFQEEFTQTPYFCDHFWEQNFFEEEYL